MARSLYDLIERFAHSLPEALNAWRAQSRSGFLDVTDRLLDAAIVHLESQANHLKAAREDTITAAAIGFFNRYGIQASSQTNSRGHVDIYIRHCFQPDLVICGEAKIWRGSKNHIAGIRQVLGYCTGRLPFCFLLIYVQTGGIEAHFATLKQTLDSELPENQQGSSRSHSFRRWALLTEHIHSSEGRVKALHAGVNLID